MHGIIGGYTGPGAKTVLPSKVHAKLSMRLVPDQDHAEIYRLLKAYVAEIAPPSVTVTVTLEHGAPASITNLDIPAMKAAAEAYATAFGKEPVFMREGGSIPVVSQFQSGAGTRDGADGFWPAERPNSCAERAFLPAQLLPRH